MKGLNRQWWVRGGAGVLAIAIHAAFVVPIVLGYGGRTRPVMPDMQGSGASALASTAQLPSATILLDLSSISTTDEPYVDELASMGIELPRSALMIASADPNPAFTPLDEEAIEDAETEAAGDTVGHALMFGRYLGQISARIERAWMRPRSALASARFSCQTKIEQDDDGRVLSVELQRCNGDARWQRSLVAAVEHASPLPAPPTRSVFAKTLLLDFSADAFQPGVTDARRYEPEMRLSDASQSALMQVPIVDSAKKLSDIRNQQGSIDLRIEGKTVTWTIRERDAADQSAATNSESAGQL